MPQKLATSVENNFTKGLVTESTGLNFPENACTACENVAFSIIGNVRSRQGINYEVGNASEGILSGFAISTFFWRSVNGDGDLNFWVIQDGTNLSFYRVYSDGSPLSTTVYHNAVALTGQFTDAVLGPQTECQFSSGMGYLFVVNPYMNPISVKFTAPNTFTATQLDIKVRDLDGLVDGLGVTERPAAGSGGYHQYNLLNQGWTDSVHGDYTNSKTIDYFQNATTKMPSNADIWYKFKGIGTTANTTSGVFKPNLSPFGEIGTQTGTTATDVELADPINTPAPRGHFLLPAFNGSRDLVYYGNLLTPSFPSISSGTARPGTTAFYAGRVWYAGVNAQGFNSNLYFTQTIETISNESKQFGNCYQVNDPTAEDLFGLLPTDGGIVKILDCGTIYKLFTIQGDLLVYASNGVWAISGGSGGFAANDYRVRKISSIQTISGTSFVDVFGMPVWWAQEGVYTIELNPQTNNIMFKSLSFDTIQTFFDEIPLASKALARGYFNPTEYTIQWIYRTTPAANLTESYCFDGILNYITTIKSFSPWIVNTSKVGLHGIVVIDKAKQTDNTELQLSHSFKYYCSHNNLNGTLTATIADNMDADHPGIDWYSHDNIGSPYEATFTVGYKLHGQGMFKIQVPYLYTYSINDKPNAFYLQGIWDYANTPNSGRWSSRQQVNNFSPNYGTIVRKHRIRGRGLVLQFKVTSVQGMPFNLAGWAVYEAINTGV